ncbi:WD40-repeat-containing domain protein [Mycena capillaripes]|nr:WD40-repeat-containing domain protein [Mycena capillaripes]
MAEYSHYKTLVPHLPRKAGAVNALLFFEAGTMLASGGDDQVLRIWDVRSGDCQQELNDASWGQITNLSSLDNVAGLSLFVGTGRGVVSVFPWNTRAKQFTDQSRTSFNVFELDVPVESQCVDPIGSRFAAASRSGQIRMYSVQDRKILVPVWSFLLDSSIPRNITFLGKKKETVVVHSLRTGLLRCYDSEPALKPSSLSSLGFVAFSPDEQLKAVHDLNTDCYVLYNSARPTTPWHPSHQQEAREKSKEHPLLREAAS